MVDQISIFMENKKGAMRELLGIIAAEDINVLGYVTNDSAEFGIVRVITTDNDKAVQVLKGKGYQCKKSKILGVELEDKPGTMADLMDTLGNMNVNIDYMYLGYSREANMPVTLIHCDSMDLVGPTLTKKGYKLY